VPDSRPARPRRVKRRERLEKVPPRGLVLHHQVIAGLEGDEARPGDQAGDDPSFLERDAYLAAAVQNEGRAPDQARLGLHVEHAVGPEYLCSGLCGRREGHQVVEGVDGG